MKKNFIVAASLIVILFIGCAEKPNSTVGNNLVDQNQLFTIAETTFTAKSDTTFYRPIIGGYGVSNLVGRISPSEQIISLYNFIAPRNSYFDSLKGAVIDTVQMFLIVNYHLNKPTVPLQFDIFEINSSSNWSEAGFTSDSISKLNLGATAIGSFSDSMNYGQEVKARVTDTSVVRRWIKAYTDTGNVFKGFAIKAKINQQTGIVGFAPFNIFSSTSPRLMIKYTSKFGRKDSVVIANGEDTFIADPTIPKSFEVRGGFGVRSKITFDVSSLKDNPIINNATLELTLNSSASSLSGFSPDTITAILGASSTKPNPDTIVAPYFIFGVRKDKTQTINPVYIFSSTETNSITKFLQSWINRLPTNQLPSNEGIVLRWGAETSTTERAVFFRSTDADPTKRPLLKILYSKK